MGILKTIRAGLAGTALALAALPAAAQDWPGQPVTVLIPFSPGGANDTVARTMGSALEETFGVPFTPVNATGAGGFVAAQQLVAGRADGYTVSHQSLGTFILTSLMNEQQVDPLEDLTFVAQMAQLTSAVAVPASSEYETLQDLIDALQASDGSMTWGHTGEGGFHHVNGVSFLDAIGAEGRDVPFDGSSASRAALLGEQIDYAILSTSNYLGFENELRFLAFFSDSADAVLPDVPTMGDLGIDLVYVETPSVWVVPAGTDQAIVDQLSAAISEVVGSDAYRDELISLGITPAYRDGAEVRELIQNRIGGWQAIIDGLDAE
ncbi:tripartite tricarboxylate transporter substrate binding protein [Rhodobacterales bacterium HKCCE2091]|nr:tripartite tricarboxylate transporter substrate binding protein [Rhodobacterales bacterium HKCCE2091]